MKDFLQNRPRVSSPSGAKPAKGTDLPPPVFDAALFGSVVHATVDDAASAAAGIQSALEAAGIAVSRIAPIRPSLEDVFVSLIEVS